MESKKKGNDAETQHGFLFWLYWLVKKYPWSQRLHVLCDYLSLYREKGLSFEEYYSFEFEKRDNAFRDYFLGKNEARYYIDLLNPMKYYILSRNKYLAHRVLENVGVRMPVLYCCYNPEGNYDENEDCAMDVYGVCRILRSKDVHSCVIKGAEGSHGDGVWVVKAIEYREDDALLTGFDDKQTFLSKILKGSTLLFESVVNQTKQFAGFNDTSVNTVRFMTNLYPNGEVKIIAIWFKVGRAGRCVDNAGGGGNVDGAVDIETGRLYNVYQFDGWRHSKKIECHPDSGTRIEGVVIDNWDKIKSEVIRFQQAFPYCKAAGWDIAITDEGPVVVEVNDFWDTTGQFFIGHGWRDSIRECYMAWNNINRDYAMERQPNVLKADHLGRITAR